MQRDIRELSPHPLSIEIYGPVEITTEFLGSVAEFGILTPLLILPDGTIISGHRRWLAAKERGLKDVPIVLSDLTEPLDIEQAVIESNRQRVKTFSQKMREAEELERIRAERERRGRPTILKERELKVQTFAPLITDASKSRDIIAAQIGIGSGEQYRKAKKIWEAAQGGDAVAKDQVAKLDADETTIHAATRTIQGENTANCHRGVDPVGYDGDEWFTPLEYIEAARKVMGDIDLDPATRHAAQKEIKAKSFFTKQDDGLSQKWSGRVWLNPPYSSRLCPKFVAKIIEEFDAGNIQQGIILVNNSTETAWLQSLLGRFPACFVRTRMKFWRDNGQVFGARQGQVVFYLGNNITDFINVFSNFGIVGIKA